MAVHYVHQTGENTDMHVCMYMYAHTYMQQLLIAYILVTDYILVYVM